MIVYFVPLLIMTWLGATASLFLKKASGEKKFVLLLKSGNLYIGGILYIVSAGLNIWLLRYLDYSVVLPLTSFTYIWTMVLSCLILKEKITKAKIIGVVLILMGAVFISM